MLDNPFSLREFKKHKQLFLKRENEKKQNLHVLAIISRPEAHGHEAVKLAIKPFCF